MYVWTRAESARLLDAVAQHWRESSWARLSGWLFAVGGAFALASLEFHGIVSTTTSDELGIIVVLYGVGIGALNAYTFRPVED